MSFPPSLFPSEAELTQAGRQDTTLVLLVNINLLKPKQLETTRILCKALRDGPITNNLHDPCCVSVVILKHRSRLYRPEALHSTFGFCTSIGMGLSQRGAINELVWREMTSLGISLCDAYLRWAHTWEHTSAESGTRPRAAAEVTVARNLQEKRTSWESKLGCQRGKMRAKSSADSLLFPIYHSFIQVKVILFPDLALWIKWTNLPPTRSSF